MVYRDTWARKAISNIGSLTINLIRSNDVSKMTDLGIIIRSAIILITSLLTVKYLCNRTIEWHHIIVLHWMASIYYALIKADQTGKKIVVLEKALSEEGTESGKVATSKAPTWKQFKTTVFEGIYLYVSFMTLLAAIILDVVLRMRIFQIFAFYAIGLIVEFSLLLSFNSYLIHMKAYYCGDKWESTSEGAKLFDIPPVMYWLIFAGVFLCTALVQYIVYSMMRMPYHFINLIFLSSSLAAIATTVMGSLYAIRAFNHLINELDRQH